MGKIDFSIIKTVRVSHQQFESIKNKAKYLIIQDKDNGNIMTFIPEEFDNKDSLENNIFDSFDDNIKKHLNIMAGYLL